MAETTPVYMSGLNATVTIAGYTLSVVRWSFPRPVNITEFRNSGTNGDTYVAAAFRRPKQFTVVLDYDSANDPLEGTSVELFEGATVTGVELIKNKLATPVAGYYIPSAVIMNINEDVNVDGKIIQTITFMINGPYQQIGAGSGGAGGSGL